MNPLTWLNPGVWLALLLAIASSFGAGYWRGDVAGSNAVQVKWNESKTELYLLAQKAEAANRATESRLKTQVIEAQNANNDRIKKIQTDANSARAQSDSLRHDLAAVRSRLPGLAADAVRSYADAATVVFDECQRSYQDMAATADADRADDRIQQIIDIARAQAAAAPCLRANGKCHYCGECVGHKMLFCDLVCRDDFSAEEEQLRRMGR
jgi:hypothetical protein